MSKPLFLPLRSISLLQFSYVTPLYIFMVAKPNCSEETSLIHFLPYHGKKIQERVFTSPVMGGISTYLDNTSK